MTLPLASTRAEALPLLRLAFPIVAGLAASTFIGVVDTLFIAPLGTLALAGAALTGAMIVILYAALYGFVAAVGVEAAHRHGAGDGPGVARVLRAGLGLGLLAGLGGAAAMALAFLALPWLGQPPEVLAILAPYWLAMSVFLVPVAVLYALSQVLNAIDRPWTAAGLAFVGVVLNVPLNWVLVWGIGGWPGLGLLGAGIASLLAETAAVAAGLWWFARRGWLAQGTPEPGLMRRLARQGAPMGLGYAGEGGAYALVALLLGLFGAVALAANQIVQAVGGVLYMLPMGMAAAVTIRVGQALGAGEAGRLRPILGAALGMVSAVNLGVTVALLLFGRAIAGALSDDPAVVELATAMFVAVALIQVADGVQSSALGALRGLRDYDWPTGFTLACYWLFALPLAAALGLGAGWGPLGVWAGYGLGIVLAAVVLPWRFAARTRIQR
jgi:MATE family multidrug resistance protein